MRIAKTLLIINGATLGINGIIVWLTVVKTFPAMLGVFLFLSGLAGAVWLSCYINRVLPWQRRRFPPSFYSAPTEKVERI